MNFQIFNHFLILPGDELLENHVDLASLSPERRAKVEEELKKELAKVSA